MRLTLTAQAPAVQASNEPGRGRGLLRVILVVLLLAWGVRSFLFAPFSIPSGSMLPALLAGDYVLVAKWPYGYSRYSFPLGVPAFDKRMFAALPERGDIVVFRAPRTGSDFVKRVVALPGDRVELRSGMLLLNGRAVPRQSEGLVGIPVSANSPCRAVEGPAPRAAAEARTCLYPAYRERLPGGRSYRVLDQARSGPSDEFAPVIVPEGHVFLLGDNRDDSLDSRFPPDVGGVGFVPVENLIGRASVTVWSTNGSAEYLKPWTWFSALRAERLGMSVGQ